MIVKRMGRCYNCKRSTSESREFVETADLFDPKAEGRINSSVAQAIVKWRATKLLCEEER